MHAHMSAVILDSWTLVSYFPARFYAVLDIIARFSIADAAFNVQDIVGTHMRI